MSSYYPSRSPLSYFHLPSSLPAVTISFLRLPRLCVCTWASLHVQVSASILVCLCVYNWKKIPAASSRSHICIVYVVFPADPLSPRFLLTPLIHHPSSVLTFYLFCCHLPSPIFLRASFPSYYSLFLSTSFLIPLSRTFPSHRSVSWFVFAASYFSPCFSFTLFSHCIPPSILAPFSLLFDLYLSCSFPSSAPRLSLSRVADLFLQLSLHFLLLFSPLSSHFYALVLSFSPHPPPFLLFVHLLLSPPSCILPLSLIRPASIPSLWKSSPCLSLLSPPVPPSFLALLCLFISRSDSSLLFLPLFIYTRSPVSSFHNIPPSFFC